MTTVYVPGVALSVLKGFIGSQPYVVTHHWQPGSITAPWSQSDINLLGTSIQSAWSTSMKAYQCTNVTITEVDAMDLTSATGVGTINTFTAVNGTRTGSTEPASTAAVIRNNIPARYRGGKPRTFWPGPGVSDMLNEYQWAAAFSAAFPGAVASFVSNVRAPSYSFGTNVLNHVIPRYTYTITDDPVHHKYRRTRSGLLSVTTVASYTLQTRIGSQRKRLVN